MIIYCICSSDCSCDRCNCQWMTLRFEVTQFSDDGNHAYRFHWADMTIFVCLYKYNKEELNKEKKKKKKKNNATVEEMFEVTQIRSLSSNTCEIFVTLQNANNNNNDTNKTVKKTRDKNNKRKLPHTSSTFKAVGRDRKRKLGGIWRIYNYCSQTGNDYVISHDVSCVNV